MLSEFPKTLSRKTIGRSTSEAFEEFLNFLYTGKCEKMFCHEIELLELANKFEVPLLKCLCELAIAHNMNEENSPFMYEVAQLHNCSDDLKQTSFELVEM